MMDETIAAEVISCLKTFFGDILQNCSKKVTLNESVLLTGELYLLLDNNEKSKVFVHERMRKIKESGNFACVSGSHSIKCKRPSSWKENSVLVKNKESGSHLTEVTTENKSNSLTTTSLKHNNESCIDKKTTPKEPKKGYQSLILSVQGDERLTFSIDTDSSLAEIKKESGNGSAEINESGNGPGGIKESGNIFQAQSEEDPHVVVLRPERLPGIPSDHSLHLAINEKLDNAVAKSADSTKVAAEDFIKFVADVNEMSVLSEESEDVSILSDNLPPPPQDQKQNHDKTTRKGEKKKYCDECNKGFYKYDTLMRHKMIHHAGVHPYTCSVCNKGFNNKYSYEDHLQRHTDSLAYQCSDCGKCYRTSQDLKQHVRIIHRLQKSQCPQCGKSVKYLKRHMEWEHGDRKFVCPTCGEGFMRDQLLQQHLLKHSGEKPHSCTHCGKAFRLLLSLQNHQICHHSGDRKFECVECGKKFFTSYKLSVHRKSHENARAHKCGVCGRGFNHRNNLTRHMAFHSGLKPFRCQLCLKEFTLESHLKRHMRTHVNHVTS